jgi:hypothetical protein
LELGVPAHIVSEHALCEMEEDDDGYCFLLTLRGGEQHAYCVTEDSLAEALRVLSAESAALTREEIAGRRGAELL